MRKHFSKKEKQTIRMNTPQQKKVTKNEFVKIIDIETWSNMDELNQTLVRMGGKEEEAGWNV